MVLCMGVVVDIRALRDCRKGKIRHELQLWPFIDVSKLHFAQYFLNKRVDFEKKGSVIANINKI